MIIGNNYVFIAVPKVASTSMRVALISHPHKADHSPYNGKVLKKLNHFTNDHVPLSMVREVFPRLRSRFTFGFVRNPFDRFVSFCSSTFVNFGSINESGPITFNRDPQRFMRLMINYSESVGKMTTHVWQMRQILLDDGQFPSFVGRYESLQDDFNIICDKVNLPRTTLEPKNTSERTKDFRSYYTTDLVDKVTELYKDDITLFGYRFE